MLFFDYMLEKSENFGIKREQICLDMGIGFGKDYEDNLTLIKNIKRLKRQDVMLLTALSNKRVIKAASHSDAENCLLGTNSRRYSCCFRRNGYDTCA